MQVDEVASHPLFEPIPGVPVEAEALVALPLEHAGEVVGVLQVSRLRRRTFTRHEHDLLRILALNVAVALGASCCGPRRSVPAGGGRPPSTDRAGRRRGVVLGALRGPARARGLAALDHARAVRPDLGAGES